MIWDNIFFRGSGIGGELCIRIFRIQKRVIGSMVGEVQEHLAGSFFKELNILTLASLHIFKVTCFIR
jgi:hypothetical protein